MYVNSELCVLPSTHASEYTYLGVHTEYILRSMYFGVHASYYTYLGVHAPKSTSFDVCTPRVHLFRSTYSGVCDGDFFIQTASPDKNPHTQEHISRHLHTSAKKLRTDTSWLMNIGRISDLGRHQLAHEL
jgi:hypothetical protein